MYSLIAMKTRHIARILVINQTEGNYSFRAKCSFFAHVAATTICGFLKFCIQPCSYGMALVCGLWWMVHFRYVIGTV